MIFAHVQRDAPRHKFTVHDNVLHRKSRTSSNASSGASALLVNV